MNVEIFYSPGDSSFMNGHMPCFSLNTILSSEYGSIDENLAGCEKIFSSRV